MALWRSALPFVIAAEDEYMLSDTSLLPTKFVSVPPDFNNNFHPGALVAGIVAGVLASAGFPAQ